LTLLLNRPIIFLPYDLNQYIGIRGLNFDFYSNSTGLKLNNNSSYINSLKIYFEDPSTEKAVRIRVINKFMYDKSSECIIEKIR